MLPFGPISSLPISTTTGAGGGGGGAVGETEYNASFASITNTSYYDWVGVASGANYDSHLTTYYIIPEESMTWMQSPYIYTFLANDAEEQVVLDSTGETVVNSANVTVVVSDASCLLNAIWDWADSITASEANVSRDIEIYKYRDGYVVSVAKNKIRGRGKALQLRYRSSEGKSFNLLGWGAWISKNKAF